MINKFMIQKFCQTEIVLLTKQLIKNIHTFPKSPRFKFIPTSEKFW